jgi:hypothetical protein
VVYFIAGEWPVSYVGTGCSAFVPDQGDDSGEIARLADDQAQFEEMAVNLLWNWSGRVFGTRVETVRPARVRTPWRPTTFEGLGPVTMYGAYAGINGWGWLPFFSGGEWFQLYCGECGAVACQHADPRALHLPGPVQAVSAVDIGGIALDPADYRVEYGHTLIRQDGETWPREQDLYAAPGTENTWSVTFEHGVPVPAGGQVAAGLLACELYKAYIQDPDCGLPSRVQSVTRQGVSLEVVQTTFARANTTQESWTGLYSVDAWISSVIQPRVYVGIESPETRRKMGSGWSLGASR